jgi:hypothetical protein
LDFGATLYRPATGLVQALSSSDEPAKPTPLDGVPFEINGECHHTISAEYILLSNNPSTHLHISFLSAK